MRGVAVLGHESEFEVGPRRNRQEWTTLPPPRHSGSASLTNGCRPQTGLANKTAERSDHCSQFIGTGFTAPGLFFGCRWARLLRQTEDHLADDVALNLRRSSVNCPGTSVQERTNPG